MKRNKVLIIEDDPIYQKIITSALSHYQFEIAGCAATMEEALILLDNTDFDIALVDIYLGDHTTGLALGKLIRQKHHRPFIFISGVEEASLLEAAILSKSSCYLTKPFSIETLILNIKNTLNQFENAFDFLENSSLDSSSTFFFAKSGKNLKRIEWIDVVCLRSDRNYTKVITKDDELYMIRCSLQIALTHIIPTKLQANFVQINRGEILQVSYIKEFSNNSVFVDSKEFYVSEGYIKSLKLKLNIIL
jgi:DNA-binding response OmpR family regulator